MPPTAPTTLARLAAAVLTLAAAGCGNPDDERQPPADTPPPVPMTDESGRSDFDGDGFADLVVDVPAATVGGRDSAGYIALVPGSADGPDTSAARVLSRESEGVPGDLAEGDEFGRGSVAGDFDGDGFADLLVGTGGGSWDEEEQGPVLLWGSEDGLGEATHLDPDADLGAVGEAGDFDGDGHFDVVGYGDLSDGGSGAFRFLYGPFSRDGEPASTGVETPGTGDQDLGLVAGDMNGDGRTDLVGFRSFEEMAYETFVWLGSDSGLEPAEPLPAANEGTVADVDGDGYGDLVMRLLPHGTVEDPPYTPSPIMVAYGSADGPGERRTTLSLDTEGVPGEEADGDQFGFELVSGDVDGDGYGDVAAGVTRPDPDSGRSFDAGDVVLLRGGAEGLSGAGAVRYGSEDAGVSVPTRSDPDGFNGTWPRTALRMLDADGDGTAEVFVGGPVLNDEGQAGNTGPVWAFRDTDEGLTGVLSLDLEDIGGPTGPDSGYGQSFAG